MGVENQEKKGIRQTLSKGELGQSWYIVFETRNGLLLSYKMRWRQQIVLG